MTRPAVALAAVRVKRRFWRMLSPRWAHDPTSATGAAKHGGRFNATGQAALYMSADFVTAVAEYEQDLGIRPGTLCAYAVDVRGIVDLGDPRVLADLGIRSADLRGAWKHAALVRRRRPRTRDIAARLVEAGANGILVPSVVGPGSNLVLWRWNERGAGTVRVLDPASGLPGRVR